MGSGILVLALAISLCGTSAAQTRNSLPGPSSDSPMLQFDVVSVKLNKSGRTSGSLSMEPGGNGLIARNVPLERVVEFAFDFRYDDLISGAPAWARSERYDIFAKVAESDLPVYHKLSIGEQRAMLQSVLKSRCRLEAHLEPKMVPVYALVVSKSGQKMKEVKDAERAPIKGPDGQLTQEEALFTTPGGLRGEGVPMVALALALSGARLGRPVLDRTGLTARYDFNLEWTPEQSVSPSPGIVDRQSEGDSSKPSIFTAVQEQLGLKLEASTGSVLSLSIERLERPLEN